FIGRGLGQFARAANQDPLRLDCQIDLRPLDSCEIDTNPDTLLAAISVDRRLPGVGRELKLRPRQLVSDVLQRAVEPAQFNAANRVHFKSNLASKLITRKARSSRASFETH